MIVIEPSFVLAKVQVTLSPGATLMALTRLLSLHVALV
jgi:hypothetical protein